MREKILKYKKYLLPVVAAVAVICALLTMMGPMLNFVGTQINSPNPLASGQALAMLPTLVVMLLFLPSWITALVVSRCIKIDTANKKTCVKSICTQLGVCAGLALFVALCMAGGVRIITGLAFSFGNIFLFAALAIFAFQVIALSALNWFGMKGVVIPILFLVLGMPIIQVGYDFLPWFWKYMIYPWIPQKFMVEGVREIFSGASFFNWQTFGLLIIALVGLAALFSILIKITVKKNNPKQG